MLGLRMCWSRQMSHICFHLAANFSPSSGFSGMWPLKSKGVGLPFSSGWLRTDSTLESFRCTSVSVRNPERHISAAAAPRASCCLIRLLHLSAMRRDEARAASKLSLSLYSHQLMIELKRTVQATSLTDSNSLSNSSSLSDCKTIYKTARLSILTLKMDK